MLGAEIATSKFDTIITLYTATIGDHKPSAGYMVTRADASKWNLTNSTEAKFGTQWVCTATRGK
jgi:hypothetical protein